MMAAMVTGRMAVGIKVEEQTEYNTARILYATFTTKTGQRLGMPNRKITKLAFVLERINNPVGDVFFVIARPFDNYEFVKQRLCDASEIAGTPVWYELSFTTPPTINDEAIIYVEYLDGDASNHIRVYYQNTNVKHNAYNEHFREVWPVCWREQESWDCAYKYEYLTMGAPAVVYSIEQLCHDHGSLFGDATVTRRGQKLTIPNRQVTHLGFRVGKLNNPTGDITFGIRRVSDDGLICSKVWGDASALPVYAADVAFTEVEFDTPPTINEEVRVYAEFLNGDGTDRTAMRDIDNVKANEQGSFYSAGAWTDVAFDCTYRMKTLLP